jgi:hypothetical protein
MRALAARTVVTTVLGMVALAALVLVPAGTVDYWQAWVFVADFSLSTTARSKMRTPCSENAAGRTSGG